MTPARSEIVVYVPAGGHASTEIIASGSAIVGRPEPGGEYVKVCFEGALYRPENIKTLADRALHAAGRLDQDYPTVAKRIVPREALVAVGTFDRARGRIFLTGPHSERDVARWLEVEVLDPAELALDGGRK